MTSPWSARDVPPDGSPSRPSLANVVFEATSDALVVFDHALRYTYVNQQAATLFGRSAESLIGRGYLEEYPAAEGSEFHRAYLHTLKTGEPITFVAEYGPWGRRFENRVRATSDGVAILFNELPTEAPSVIPGIGQAAYLRTILDSSPDCLTITDRETRILDISASGLSLLEATGDVTNLRGRPASSFVIAADRPRYERAHAAAFAGEATEISITIETVTGHARRVEKRLQPLRGAGGEVVVVFGVTRDVTERAAADDARHESEQRLEAVLANAPCILIVTDLEGIVTFAMGGALDAFGITSERSIGRPIADVLYTREVRSPDGHAIAVDEILRHIRMGETIETVSHAVNGTVHASRTLPFHDAAGRISGALRLSIDITEKLDLEARLLQAQKMQAIGQLAGGIAHDFNNLLTIVVGHLELARAAVPEDSQTRIDLDQIGEASDRARTLVRQLLTFSRKQRTQPRRIVVGDVVRSTEQLLRRLIGEEIVLDVVLGDGGAHVLIDPGQVEQVLMNLAVNARDAILSMDDSRTGVGGTLSIETGRMTLDATEARRWSDLLPGRYVSLRVRDTGHGIDDETREHLFEPFFTTKDVGQGTGLGLATVFGIVQHAGGAIAVDSTPGEGALFTILLPMAPATADARPSGDDRAPRAPIENACILLVEDETSVRVAVRRMLERRNYTVYEARHGGDALLLWRTHREEIDAVITAVRMPEMGGGDLVERLRSERPTLPVVYVSGDADEGHRAHTSPRTAFVDKPFTGETLLDALGRVLRSVGAPAAGR